MIASFNCLNNDYSVEEIAEAIYSPAEDETQVQNALAWHAAEEVCRMFEE